MMASSASGLCVPSELDDEVDDSEVPFGYVWAYPCKLAVCPDYGKSWRLRSNFLIHLQECEAHKDTAKTPVVRRAIEKEWRYITDPNVPPRRAPNFRAQENPDEQVWIYSSKDTTGKVTHGKGTLREAAKHRATEYPLAAQRDDYGS